MMGIHVRIVLFIQGHRMQILDVDLINATTMKSLSLMEPAADVSFQKFLIAPEENARYPR